MPGAGGSVQAGQSRRNLSILGRSDSEASRHYRRPPERPFLESEKDHTHILLGGLTRRHERFIQAVFHGCGYKCEILPAPDQNAFQTGKEYGNNGQCSPAYFTSGSLIQYLKRLEAAGLSRRQIIDNYVFFTAGSCGPCRFGMYAAEYRMALQNSGFDGFRVIRFQQDDGVRQQSQHPGMRYTIDLGFGMLKALYLGDALNDIATNLRPYEVQAGQTDQVMEQCVEELCEHLRTYRPDDPFAKMPRPLAAAVGALNLPKTVYNVAYRLRKHLHGAEFGKILENCRQRIGAIELDRTRVKPIVKIIGEFWAQTTESAGNYRMFEFLEQEGAQVQTEALGTWITYLLAHAQLRMGPGRGLNPDGTEPGRWELKRKLRNELHFRRKKMLLGAADWIYTDQYHRIIRRLGGVARRLVPQSKFSSLADPYYNKLARGGEGYLEVAKNIYYTANHLCHMVLSLKPFGCMPSTQSDGVQSAVVNRFKDMIFLPIETSGEGEMNAYSRVQMALDEARAKAKAEFEESLAGTGQKLSEIRAFVDANPELKSPYYEIPRYDGLAGVSANFICHVHKLMNDRRSRA